MLRDSTAHLVRDQPFYVFCVSLHRCFPLGTACKCTLESVHIATLSFSVAVYYNLLKISKTPLNTFLISLLSTRFPYGSFMHTQFLSTLLPPLPASSTPAQVLPPQVLPFPLSYRKHSINFPNFPPSCEPLIPDKYTYIKFRN